MTIKQQCKALVRRYYGVVNSGELNALDEFIAPDFAHHNPGMPPGLDVLKGMLTMYRIGFPDIHSTIEFLIVENNRAAAYTTTHGTNIGTFLGHPPTGKQFTATGIDIFRIADGGLVERWGSFDTLGMLQQLGLSTPMIQRTENLETFRQRG